MTEIEQEEEYIIGGYDMMIIILDATPVEKLTFAFQIIFRIKYLKKHLKKICNKQLSELREER